MTDEIRITQEQLAADIRINLRVCRQKTPHLLRNLAALKDARGYPDTDREDVALREFADWLAQVVYRSGKRVVRDRPLSLEGAPWETAEELGVTPNGGAR